jgi:hypothetical protein
LPCNKIEYGNKRFVEAYLKIKAERFDEEAIMEAAFEAVESLRSYIGDSDWETQKTLTILKKISKDIFHLGIGYQSFLVSLHRKKTNDKDVPFIITPLTIGPCEG